MYLMHVLKTKRPLVFVLYLVCGFDLALELRFVDLPETSKLHVLANTCLTVPINQQRGTHSQVFYGLLSLMSKYF